MLAVMTQSEALYLGIRSSSGAAGSGADPLRRSERTRAKCAFWHMAPASFGGIVTGMKRSHSILFLGAGIATVGGIVGVRTYFGECCSGSESPAAVAAPASASVTTSASAGARAARVALGESVDPAFEGCKSACGSRSPALRATARAQPGAVLGDVVFCPVSGAVFRVNEGAQRREVLGKTLYFCCASCAAYFDAHRDEVLAARGIGPCGV